jgi:thiosulfate/3-mercaptopyruvate sulfurtransferase
MGPRRGTAAALVISMVMLGCSRVRDSGTGSLAAPDARHGMLTGADALAARLERDAESSIVLHVARERDAFAAGHIPTARFLRLGDILIERKGIPNELPPRESLDSVFAAAGVAGTANVVVYGEPLAAGRTFFTLDVLGHEPAATLLDGGLEAWRVAAQPVTTGAEEMTTGTPARMRASSSSHGDPVVDAAWIETRRGNARIALIDARPPEEFSGETPGDGVNRPGHIPGARNLFWKKLLRSDSLPVLHDTATLRRLFVEAGAQPGDTVVTYCRTGMQASFAYFVARYLGYEARMYDGSFLDWVREPTRAVEAGRE